MPDIAVLLSVGRHPASGRARRADRDARALELAFAMGADARVRAFHAGDPAEPALRDYLGMGLTELTVLTGADGDAGAALAQHLRRLNPAVVLAGVAAECGEGSGMLPYQVAEVLGAQLIANAVSCTLRGDSARVIQALPRGARKALRVGLPLVLTVDRAAPEGRMSAFGPALRGRIQVVAVAGMPAPEADDSIERPARIRPRRLRALGQASAAERLRSITPMRATSGQRLLDVDPQQAAQAIWQYLSNEGLVPAATAREHPEPPSDVAARDSNSGQ